MSVQSPPQVSPIHPIPGELPTTNIAHSESAPQNQKVMVPTFRIDSPHDNISWELMKTEKLNSEGIVISPQPLPAYLPESVNEIMAILKQNLHLKIVHAKNDEIINIPCREILKPIGNTYLIGSYNYTLLGKEWLQSFLNLYLKDFDIRLFEHVYKKRYDIDFKSVIHHSDDPRLKAENIVSTVAKRSTNKEKSNADRVQDDILNKKWSPFTKYHPFLHFENGNITEDTFLISHNENQVSFDFNIVRIPPGDIISTQNLCTNIQPLIDEQPILSLRPEGSGNSGMQAIFDLILLQYHFLRITPKAWARAILYNTESFKHRGPIPYKLCEEVIEFCNEYDTTAEGLYTLFKEYIEKHLENNPDALTALLFNACHSLSKHGVQQYELLKFLELAKGKIPPTSECSSFYKSIIDNFTKAPFEDIQCILELNVFLELAFESSSHRLFTVDCNYVVTHDNSDYVSSKRNGFSVLIPLNPLSTLESIWNKVNSKDKHEIIPILKGLIKAHFQQYFPDNILSANFSKSNLQIDEIRIYARKFLSHENSNVKVIGYKLLLASYQFDPSLEHLHELMIYYGFMMLDLDRGDSKASLELFGEHFVKDERLNNILLNVRIQQLPQVAYIEFLMLQFPKLSLALFLKQPNLIQNVSVELHVYFEKIAQASLTTKEIESFSKLIYNEFIKNSRSERTLQDNLISSIQHLQLGNNDRTAWNFLLAFLKANVLQPNPRIVQLWMDFMNKIKSVPKAANLIILGYKEDIWLVNCPNILFPQHAPDCIEHLLSTHHQESIDSANQFMDFIRCNVTAVQGGKMEILLRDKLHRDAEKKKFQKAIQDLKANKELSLEECMEETELLLRRCQKENVNSIKEILLDQTIQGYFKNNPNRCLSIVLASSDYIYKQKKHGHDVIQELLMRALDLLGTDTTPVQYKSLIDQTNRFLKSTENVLSSAKIIRAIVLKLPVFSAGIEAETLFNLLRTFRQHTVSLKVSAATYQQVIAPIIRWILEKNSSDVKQDCLDILKRLDVSYEPSMSHGYVGCQMELISFSIERNTDQITIFLIHSFIHYLKSNNEILPIDLIKQLIAWSLILSKNKHFVLASHLLDYIESIQKDSVRELEKVFNQFPEGILSLSPITFCKVINSLDQLELSAIPITRKARIVALSILRIPQNTTTLEQLLSIYDTHFKPNDTVSYQTLDVVHEFKCHSISERAISITQRKFSLILNKQSLAELCNGRNVHNWIRCWSSAMQIVQTLERSPIAKQFVRAQFSAALDPKSTLYYILNNIPNAEYRQSTLKKLLEKSIQFLSSSKDEILLNKLKSEQIPPSELEDLEIQIVLKCFRSDQLNNFIYGLKMIKSLVDKPSFLNHIEIISETSVREYASFLRKGNAPKEFFDAMIAISRGKFDFSVLEKIHLLLSKYNLAEIADYFPRKLPLKIERNNTIRILKLYGVKIETGKRFKIIPGRENRHIVERIGRFVSHCLEWKPFVVIDNSVSKMVKRVENITDIVITETRGKRRNLYFVGSLIGIYVSRIHFKNLLVKYYLSNKPELEAINIVVYGFIPFVILSFLFAITLEAMFINGVQRSD